MKHNIEPKDDLIKKKILGGKILPEAAEPKSVKVKELESMKLGPASYDVSHKITEPRSDLGVIPIKKDKKEKEPEMDERPEIYPDFDHDKWNKLVPKMMPDSDDKPSNLTDDQLKPEKWKFYNGNLDSVKEGIE